MKFHPISTGPFRLTREHIVACVDGSSSMELTYLTSTRFEAAKAALQGLIQSAAETLDPHSTFSLIQFSSCASVVCSRQTLDGSSVRALADRVGAMECCGGCTNITSALQRACALLTDVVNARPRIVLLTDGSHNNGRHPYSGDGLPWGIGPDGPEMPSDIHVTTIGIGDKGSESVDETLLRWLASRLPNGNKDYHYVTDDRALLVLCRQLGRGLVLGR